MAVSRRMIQLRSFQAWGPDFPTVSAGGGPITTTDVVSLSALATVTVREIAWSGYYQLKQLRRLVDRGPLTLYGDETTAFTTPYHSIYGALDGTMRLLLSAGSPTDVAGPGVVQIVGPTRVPSPPLGPGFSSLFATYQNHDPRFATDDLITGSTGELGSAGLVSAQAHAYFDVDEPSLFVTTRASADSAPSVVVDPSIARLIDD